MNLSDPAIFLYPVFCFCWPESTSTGAVLSPSWRQNPALTKMPQGIGADWERDWEERRIFNRTAGEQGWECRDEEGVGNEQELGKTRSPRRQKHLSGRSLYKLAQMQEINREIQAFMTISIAYYTIVTTFKNILPTSYSENYCFTTKPQPCKSSWYIIHVCAGFCLFFPLQFFPEYSREIHLSGPKQSFVFPSPPGQKALTRCQRSEQHYSLPVSRARCCHTPGSFRWVTNCSCPHLHMCAILITVLLTLVFYFGVSQ